MLDKKNIIVITLFSFLVITGFVFFVLTKTVSPEKIELLSVSPEPGAKETSLLPLISLTFRQKVSPNSISLASVPSLSYNLLTEREDTVIKYLPEKPLEKQTTYKLSAVLKGGGEYTWNFTTGEIEAGALPGWAVDSNKIQEEYNKQNPPEELEILNLIIEQTPYYEDDFWIEYSPRRKTFTVHLCQTPYDETRKKAEEWFNRQNLNKVIKLAPKIDWFKDCEPPILPRNPNP